MAHKLFSVEVPAVKGVTMYLHVGKGNGCWLVALAFKDKPHGWKILGSFPTSEEAVEFAHALTGLEIKIDTSTERR